MICESCRDRRHDECRGGSWCDCQHNPPPEPEDGEGTGEEERSEPRVNWLRQG
jgi:hypothetical protein